MFLGRSSGASKFERLIIISSRSNCNFLGEFTYPSDRSKYPLSIFQLSLWGAWDACRNLCKSCWKFYTVFVGHGSCACPHQARCLAGCLGCFLLVLHPTFGWVVFRHPVLKNMTSSIKGWLKTQLIWENRIHGNQTTNQLISSPSNFAILLGCYLGVSCFVTHQNMGVS